MSGRIEIRPVRDRRDIDAFIAAAYRAQGHDPRWVPPLNAEIRDTFDARKSPFAATNEMERFVALRDGEAVGRIAAILNRAHLSRYRDQCGHFGFIEAIDDRGVFAALAEAVSEWHRARGMTQIAGPYSPSVNEEVGLLVEGFDRPHMVRTNHAQPYYGRHIEALGFSKIMDLLAYSTPVAGFTERLRAIKTRAASKLPAGVRTSDLSYRTLWREYPRLHTLFNEAWSENWGAVPISERETAFMVKQLLPIIKPSWICIAESNGKLIACSVLIPDANEPIKALRGKLLPFGWLRLLWHVHVRGTRTARLPIAGIVREWRGLPMASRLILSFILRTIEKAEKANVEEIEISWILESNVAAWRPLERSGFTLSKRFRIYTRPIV